MADAIVGASSVNSVANTVVTHETRTHVRYEVWSNKTLVLKTVHETQALRYAKETQGEVRTVTHDSYS